MNKLVVISLLLLIGASAKAQELDDSQMRQTPISIITVFDDHFHAIEGAHVLIDGGNHSAVTMGNGQAMLSVPEGKRKIEVSYMGFVTYVDSIEVKKGTTELEVTLKQDTRTFCTVIITAHGNQVPGFRRDVEHLSLRSKPASGFAGVNGSLQQIAGVQVQSTGPTTGRPTVRGLSGPRIRLNVHGAPLAAQSWSADHGLELSLFSTDEIEVVRGSHALWYGSDASGGVIDYVGYTPPMESRWFGQVTLSANSNMIGGGGALRIGKDDGRRYAYIETEYTNLGAFSVPIDSFSFEGVNQRLEGGVVANTGVETSYIKAVFGEKSSRFDRSFIVDYLDRKTGFFPPLYEGEVDGSASRMTINDPYQLNRHFTLGLPLEWKSEKRSTELILNYQFDDREEWAVHHGEEALEQMLDLELNQFSAQFRSQREFGWSYGANGLYQSSEAGGEEYLIPGYNRTEVGAFTSYRRWFRKHKVDVGLRADGINIVMKDSLDSYKNFAGWSLTVGDEYKVRTSTYLLAQMSRNFRAPMIHELAADGVHHGSFRHERGNLNLDPEVSLQFGLGMQKFGDKYNFKLSTFFYDYQNYIALQPTGAPSPHEPEFEVFEYRQHEAQLFGGEVDARYFQDDWVARAMGSLVLGTSNGGYVAQMPQNKTVVGVSRRLKQHMFSLSWEQFYRQDRVFEGELATDGGAVINLDYTFSVDHVKCVLGVYNVLNNSVLNHLDVYRQFNIPRMGRSIQLQLIYTI